MDFSSIFFLSAILVMEQKGKQLPYAFFFHGCCSNVVKLNDSFTCQYMQNVHFQITGISEATIKIGYTEFQY